MTFMSVAEAKDACSFELEQYDDALKRSSDRWDELEDARADNEDAGGFLDDSTAWDVSLGIGGVVACSALTFGWCALAVLGAGAGIAASEGDRQDEIDAAKDRLQAAKTASEAADAEAERLGSRAYACLFHHLSKGS